MLCIFGKPVLGHLCFKYFKLLEIIFNKNFYPKVYLIKYTSIIFICVILSFTSGCAPTI